MSSLSPITRTLQAVYEQVVATPPVGKVADYIPELGKADPNAFGVVLVTADGHAYAVGDVDVPFTIQSISKPFVYGMALEAFGLHDTLAKVGVEPSGEAFNSISLYPDTGRPLNPMINAGAIACAGLLHSVFGERTVDRVLQSFSRLAGRPLSLDPAVYESERVTGHRNRAIGHLLRNFDILTTDAVDGPLNAYFAQCSVAVTCRDLAMMGATLANHGVNPSTGQRALAADHVHRVLSVMSSCGMYDYSGEWGFRVGLPAKSGVGGGVLAVLPGQLAIAVFSPPLDAQGNSARGIAVCEALAHSFQLHLLRTPRVGSAVIRSDLTGRELRSRRRRRPERTILLEEHGRRIRVVHAQGELSFASVEVIVRALTERAAETTHVVLDLHRTSQIDPTGIQLLLGLLDGFEREDKTLVFTRCRHLKALIEAMLSRRNSERLDIADDPMDALEECEEDVLASLESRSTMLGEVPLTEQRLMRGLTRADLSSLLPHLEQRVYPAGSIIVREGDAAAQVYFLSEGQVSVLLGDPRRDARVVAKIQAGLCFGEMAMTDRSPRSASIRADTPVICQELPFAALETPALAGVRHKLLANLAGDLADRLREANDEIRRLT